MPPELAAFLLTALLLELTPGTNMAWLAMVSAADGRRAGFAATFGIGAGLLTVALAAGVGLGRLLVDGPVALQVLRWAGAAYFVWLAWDTWRGDGTPDRQGSADTLLRVGRHGFLSNLLNVKAALFFILVMPDFIAGTQSTAMQTVILSLGYVAVATAIHVVIVLLGSRAHDWLADPHRQRRVRLVFALLLLAMGGWLLSS